MGKSRHIEVIDIGEFDKLVKSPYNGRILAIERAFYRIKLCHNQLGLKITDT